VERREEMDFLLRLARVRRGATRYLRDGTFLRPPPIDVSEATIPMSRLSIYAGQRDAVKEFEGRAPRVLASAWQAPDGGVAAALVNISDEAAAFDLSLGSPEYPVPPSGIIRKITEAGSAEVGSFDDGRVRLRVELAPADACVYEVVGR
jgi:hypothetical protein